MLSNDFVCCCIPLINTGMYFLFLAQIVGGIVIGGMLCASPAVVGAAIPSFTNYILAILCFLIAALQIIGFVGVVQEKKGMLRFYSISSSVAVASAFSTAAALIVVSGVKQKEAITTCENTYYGSIPTGTATTSLATESDTICRIFALVDIGCLAGLWVLFFIVELYFLAVVNKYKIVQKEDHSRYFSMYSTKGGFPDINTPEHIPLSSTNPNRSNDDPWTTRQSTDSYRSPPPNQHPHLPQAAPVHYADHPAEYGRGYDEEQAGYGGHEPEMKRELRGGYDSRERVDDGFAPPEEIYGHGSGGYGREEAAYASREDDDGYGRQQQQHQGYGR